jgi:RHS repeat-associated protein
LLRKFVYGPGLDEPICLLEVAENNAVYYYHFDGLGSVVALSDVNSVLVERYTYDVFGRPTIRDANGTEITASAFANPYLFTGRAYDAETGLYYYRARYYDFATGRFLQADPTGYSDGLNLYAYVGNNPLTWVDPLGLCKADHSRDEVERILRSIAMSLDMSGWLSGELGQFLLGIYMNGPLGRFDFKYWAFGQTWDVPGFDRPLTSSEFGNYLAGFTAGIIGDDAYVIVRLAGMADATVEGSALYYAYGQKPEESWRDEKSAPFIKAGQNAGANYPRSPWIPPKIGFSLSSR